MVGVVTVVSQKETYANNESSVLCYPNGVPPLMAWETRRNGHCYYYRKQKTKGRVLSQYAGAGLGSVILEQLDKANRTERAHKRLIQRTERAQLAEIEQTAQPFYQLVDLLARAALLAAGNYQHRGQWRRRKRDK